MAFISSKGVYAVAAMQRLSIIEEKKPLQIKDIANEQGISQNYLEQILNKLKKAGFVQSIRGSQGGYLLAKSPKDIKIKDIIEALEGDMKLVDTDVNNHIVNLFFEDMQEKINKLFEYSLYDLKKYQIKYNENLHYII